MKIGVRYMAQIKMATGVATEQVDLERPCPVQEFMVRLAESRGDPWRTLLLDPAGALQPTLLLFVGDNQVTPDEGTELRDGDTVTVLSPMAGG